MVLSAIFAFAPSPLEKIEHTTAQSTHTVPKVDKPVETASEPSQQPIVKEQPKPQPKPEKPKEPPKIAQPASSGDCASELKKYDWPQAVAYRVMMKESSNDPNNLNDTPATKDYSVGCFQVNLYGANARSRPSEAYLKVASNNVAYAYGLWKGTRSFHQHWPNTCRMVGC